MMRRGQIPHLGAIGRKEHVDGSWELEIVSRAADAKGWVLLPRRWVAERTFAWLGRFRINSKEF
jgi:transposase